MPPNSGALGLEFHAFRSKNIQSYTSSCIQIKFLYLKEKIELLQPQPAHFQKMYKFYKIQSSARKERIHVNDPTFPEISNFRADITGTQNSLEHLFNMMLVSFPICCIK